jgi:hypothetical protein
LSEPAQELEDPCTEGNVEHRDRLVGHEELRAERERRRNSHTLSLATRELVRISVEVQRGGSQSGLLERCCDLGSAFGSRAGAVDGERLLDGCGDTESRVE